VPVHRSRDISLCSPILAPDGRMIATFEMPSAHAAMTAEEIILFPLNAAALAGDNRGGEIPASRTSATEINSAGDRSGSAANTCPFLGRSNGTPR
jgi:hypothetical protein